MTNPHSPPPAVNQSCRADRAPVGAAGDADIRVVLLRAVNVIGERVVYRHVIKLRGRLVVLRRPSLAAVGGNAGAAVVRVADAIRILSDQSRARDDRRDAPAKD